MISHRLVQKLAGLWFLVAGIHGALSVGLGAYAAHGLADQPAAILDLMEKATRYQLIHAVALLAVAIGSLGPLARIAGCWLAASGALLAIGTTLFCGALYAIALGGIAAGPVAPYGGTSLILAWLLLIPVSIQVLRRPPVEDGK